MKLTLKDLKLQKFTIEAEPSETIGALKEKIAADKGWEASSQMLIYSGKILKDDNTIESYKIEEKGFIVCRISKPKPAPKPAAAAAAAAPSTPAPAPAASTPAAPAPAAAASQPTTAQPPATPSPAPASAAAANNQGFNDPSALAIGDDRAAAISNMEAMGFPRTDIDRAMRAAFFNPDRAVDYLLNGIPANAQQEQAAQAAAPQSAAPQAQAQTTGGGTETAAPPAAGGDEPVNLFEAAAAAGRGGNTARAAAPDAAAGGNTGAAAGNVPSNLDFLRLNPQFQQLRTVVQQQPQMLEPILQQVAAGNPQLAQMITQNTEEFMRLLSEDGGEGEEGDVQLPPGMQQVAVSEEERDAIERVRDPVPLMHDRRRLLTFDIAMPPRLRARHGHPGILRLRQERGARRQLPLRPARRAGGAWPVSRRSVTVVATPERAVQSLRACSDVRSHDGCRRKKRTALTAKTTTASTGMVQGDGMHGEPGSLRRDLNFGQRRA